MNHQHWILEGREPKPVSLMEWANWFESADRHVARTTLEDGTYISTVFLGLDHRFGGDGPPLLFETMVFPSNGNFSEEYMNRYSTWDEAEAGHEKAVAWAKNGKKKEEEVA